MRRIHRFQMAAVASCVGALYFATGVTFAAQRTVVRSEALGAAEAKIYKELDATTEIEFFDAPLSDVLQYLEDYHGLQIEIDDPALHDIGLSTDHPITRSLQGITLRSALKLMLEGLELCWEIRDEVLMNTSLDAASARMVVRVYDVLDLLGHEPTANELSEVVRDAFPKSTDERGSVTPFHNMLIVRESQHGHEQIQRLLTEMRKVARKPQAAATARRQDPFASEAE